MSQRRNLDGSCGAIQRYALTYVLLLCGCLFGLLGSNLAFAAPPPANSTIGNQASASYTDASGITGTTGLTALAASAALAGNASSWGGMGVFSTADGGASGRAFANAALSFSGINDETVRAWSASFAAAAFPASCELESARGASARLLSAPNRSSSNFQRKRA